MSNEDEILKELRLIRAVLMANAAKDMTQREVIALLANAGLGPKEIATSIGTTPGTVNVALTALRKAGKVKKNG